VISQLLKNACQMEDLFRSKFRKYSLKFKTERWHLCYRLPEICKLLLLNCQLMKLIAKLSQATLMSLNSGHLNSQILRLISRLWLLTLIKTMMSLWVLDQTLLTKLMLDNSNKLDLMLLWSWQIYLEKSNQHSLEKSIQELRKLNNSLLVSLENSFNLKI